MVIRGILLFLLCFHSWAQPSLPLPENVPFDERRFGDFRLFVPDQPLTFDTSIIQNDGVTIIDTPEGTLLYGIQGTQGILTLELEDETYTGTGENFRLVPGFDKSRFSGENLRFTSDTNERVTTIDRFSFFGNDSEFKFKLNEVHSTGDGTDWGAKSFTLNRENELYSGDIKKLYVRKENGDFFEIGKAEFSEEDKTVRVKSLVGREGDTDYSAGQLQFTRVGDTDIIEGTDIYVGKGPDDFVKVGTANLVIEPDSKTLGLTSLVGSKDGYNFSMDTLDISEIDDDISARATGIFVKNKAGDFVQIGTADYSDAEKKLKMTSIVGKHSDVNFSAGQLELFQEGDANKLKGLDIYIGKGPEEFVKVGTADLSVTDDEKSLVLTSISGKAEGYDFSADTFSYLETDEDKLVSATGVFVKNTAGDFVQIGTADYSDANKKLTMTSILGKYEDVNFSAGQLQLFQEGDTDRLKGMDIYIGKGPEEFIKVATADLSITDDEKSLKLTSIDGRAEGYDFSADTFSYLETSDDKLVSATGVFVRNAEGNFVKIGTADYSEAQKRLVMTSIDGKYDGTSFTAAELEVFRKNDADFLKGSDLYIGRDPGEFVKVGKVDLMLSDNGNTLKLIDITGETNGFKLSADKVLATNNGDFTRAIIDNGSATRNREKLTFGNAVVTTDGERIDGDFRDFFVTDGDLSYSSDRLVVGTNGDSIDLKTKGQLNTGSLILDTRFEGREINSIGAEFNTVENDKGRVVKADGIVSIGTTENGGIKDIGISLGDEISFTAKDKEGNARELTAAFSYDEKEGKFYLKTVFKGGDETEIKIYPFKFTSEKIGDDAVAALSVQLNKQNIESYLYTMSRIVDLEKVNDFLAIGEDRMQVRIGKGAGLEFYYQSEAIRAQRYDFNNMPLRHDRTDTAFSLGFFNRGPDGGVTSGGILFSADSNLQYNVEAGKMSIGGMELPDQGEIPLTIGTYYRHEDADGNAIFGTLGTSLADIEHMADTGMPVISGGLGFKKAIFDDNAYLTGQVAGNTKGDWGVGLGISIPLGRVNNSPRRSVGEKSYYDPSTVGEWNRDIHASFR